MTQYIVHIYREMRLSFADIEADTPEAAAAIAGDKPTADADNIEDCDGESLAALVDLAGDEEYEQSLVIDFEQEKQRKAAPALLAALEAVIDFAESEAHSLANHKDSPECEAEAERAWEAIEPARAAIAQAKASGIAPADIDIHALLGKRREIGVIWAVEDVQEVRPDLSPEQSWEVLKATERYHDATVGISWDVLKCHADMLYGDAHEADDHGGTAD